MLNKHKKTAVLFCNGIGNFIMATPFISMLNEPEIVLLDDDPRSAEIASISCWPSRIVPRNEVCNVVHEYETAYALWAFPLDLIGDCKHVVVQKNPKWKDRIHEARSYFSVSGKTCADDIKYKIQVVPSWNLYKAEDEFLVAIANGASPRLNWKNKRWPTERLVEFAETMVAKYSKVQFVFLGSKNEKEIGDAIVKAVGARCWNFAGMLTFSESCDALDQCDAMVVNDTALMHAGAALGVPMVVLWSYSPLSKNNPNESKTSGSTHIICQSGGCNVYPCYGDKQMWSCTNPVCVNTIQAKEVVEWTSNVLGTKINRANRVGKKPSNIQVAVDDYGENHWLKKKIYRNLTTKPWHASRIDAVCENMDGDEILDVACATGELTDKIRLAANPRRIVGYEGCLEVIKQGRAWYPQIEFIHGLVENMPFERKSFDSVHAGEIIEHVGDPEGFVRSIAEIARHKVVITTPKTVVEDPAHINIWTEPAFREMLAKQFESVQIINTDRCMVAVCEGPR